MTNKSRDIANIQAAQQDAEEKKLERKKSFRNVAGVKQGSGVSFNSEEKLSEEEPEEETLETVVSEDDADPTKHEVHIISNGLYKDTQVLIDGKLLINPEIFIRISKQSGVSIEFIKKESLFS